MVHKFRCLHRRHGFLGYSENRVVGTFRGQDQGFRCHVDTSPQTEDGFLPGAVLPNLSRRYVAALAQLSQFHYVLGNKHTLTHILSGVQVGLDSEDKTADDSGCLRLTFKGGHTVSVEASYYLELMLSEHAAHEMHAASDGTGEIHKRAKHMLEHLAREHELDK